MLTLRPKITCSIFYLSFREKRMYYITVPYAQFLQHIRLLLPVTHMVAITYSLQDRSIIRPENRALIALEGRTGNVATTADIKDAALLDMQGVYIKRLRERIRAVRVASQGKFDVVLQQQA